VNKTYSAQVNENEQGIEGIHITADIRARREESVAIQIIYNSAEYYADRIDNRDYKAEFTY
jgi:hypothetical protein